jgi:hypothetical protein
MLDLAFNRLGVDGKVNGKDGDAVAGLAARLVKLPRLTTLSLRHNYCVSHLVPQLTQLKGLTTLDLGYLAVGEYGVPPLVLELGKLTGLGHPVHRQKWDWGCGCSGSSAGPGQAHGSHHVVFGRQRGVVGMAALAPALGKLTGLTFLNLMGNMIGGFYQGRGAANLAPALGNITRLTFLNLFANVIGDNGATALAPALGKLTRLTFLNVFGNGIGDVGMAALAPELDKLTKLPGLPQGTTVQVGFAIKKSEAARDLKLGKLTGLPPGTR